MVDAAEKKPKTLLLISVSQVSGPSTVSHVTSSNGVSCPTWDLDEEDMDTGEEMEVPNPSDICRRFSSELRKKFEVRLITNYDRSHN